MYFQLNAWFFVKLTQFNPVENERMSTHISWSQGFGLYRFQCNEIPLVLPILTLYSIEFSNSVLRCDFTFSFNKNAKHFYFIMWPSIKFLERNKNGKNLADKKVGLGNSVHYLYKKI